MSTSRFFRLLIAVALFALPVAAISAQSDTADGYVWDGASDWPGVTHIVAAPDALAETEPGDIYLASVRPGSDGSAPWALPVTGRDKISEPAIKNWRFEGFTLVPDWAVGSEPAALPVTGSGEERPLLDGAYNEEFTSASDLVPLGVPAALPQTGNASPRPPFFGALPPYLVSEQSFDAYTALLARGSRSPQEPSILPATGSSGGSIVVPSDPPLIGDTAGSGDVAVQDAAGTPSDPPLLGVSGPTDLPATGNSGGGNYVVTKLPVPGWPGLFIDVLTLRP